VNLQEQEQLVRSHYNRISDKWGDLYKDEVTFANYNFIVRKRHVMSLFDKVGGHYLDAGCGTGDFIPDLLDRSGSVTALDFAEDMIEQSRTRMARRHLDQQVSFVVGDVTNLEYDDNSFDAVLALYVASVVPSPARFAAEMRRVCIPGGTIVLVNHFTSENWALRWMERRLAHLARHIGFHADFPLDKFLRDSELRAREIRPSNLFGYWRLLRCINEKPASTI